MSTDSNKQSVYEHFAYLLAAFKVASYTLVLFQIGSVAAWLEEYWFPFTHFIWDSLTTILRLPELPLYVKDSLTALLFFLPLGVSTINSSKLSRKSTASLKTTVIAAVFGILILYLMASFVIKVFIHGSLIGVNAFDSSWFLLYLLSIVLLSIISDISRSAEIKESNFKRLIHALGGGIFLSVIVLIIFGSFAMLFFTLVGIYITVPSYKFLVTSIIVLTVMCIVRTVYFRSDLMFKLAGAVLALILSAAVFELVLHLKVTVENIS